MFCSTNKVYGDLPNALPLLDLPERLELPDDHRWYRGIDTTMSIDRSTHSLFGVSKAAADLLVQEYGRYFDMPTVCFRGGCLTGPGHAGAELHGFLAYLMKCTVTGDPYTIYGYDGQAGARQHPQRRPGGRASPPSTAPPAPRRSTTSAAAATATARCSRRSRVRADRRARLNWTLSPQHRIGDHRWWISDLDGLPRRLPGLAAQLRDRGDPAGDPRRQHGPVAGDRLNFRGSNGT